MKARNSHGYGCAIVYNENRFKVTKLDVYVPKVVEACWLILKPLNKTDLFENIAMAAIYVSPTSKFKQQQLTILLIKFIY